MLQQAAGTGHAPLASIVNLVNGIEADSISVLDRGLAYGDGVFRTFVVREGRAPCWQRHYDKLAADCNALKLECPPAALLERDLDLVAARKPDCAVKIVVTRGAGARGYTIPAQMIPTRIVTASELPVYPQQYYFSGVRVRLCDLRLGSQPSLAGIKHLNRLEQVLARAEWSDPSIAEGLMCDGAGHVICGTMSNLFLIERGDLIPPQLTQCGVAGVQRARVLELAQARGIRSRILDITVDELEGAEEAFLINSVIGIWQIAALGHRSWSAGGMTAQIRSWLADVEER